VAASTSSNEEPIMIWLYITAVGAGLTILIALATRPISAALGLIQTLAFVALTYGLFGWFAVLQDPVFLWYIGVGGGIWLLTSLLRWSGSA
jgi:hypothetical protein